jgi:hypothetical protein
MAKTTKKLEVVVANKTMNVPATKADVPAAIEQLKAQLKVLEGDAKTEVDLNVDYDGTKVKDVDSVKRLLEMSASIHARAEAFTTETARFKMEGKVKPFDQSGKSVKQWESIIAKAIFELTNATKIKQIKSAIEQLSTHLDEETRLQNDLAKIMDLASQPLS